MKWVVLSVGGFIAGTVPMLLWYQRLIVSSEKRLHVRLRR